MYLKEGDVGQAESEEVVPVKTEMEITGQIGSAVRCPGSTFPAPASRGADCRPSTEGRPLGESFTSISSFNLHSNPIKEENCFAGGETGWVKGPSHRRSK